MRDLELLAPAKNKDIGIAAIDCGADAVYIAGPAFGARQAAGNSMEDIRQLCDYAHKFGARIYLTLNTILFDNEMDEAYALMCDAEDAGVDALIVQDLAVMKMAEGGKDGKQRRIHIPLHASTQCAIRDVRKAVFYKDNGFSRLVLERELPLSKVKEISEATGCEIEFFVHGAICVCYNGQCYMSESITGRSANRGECIQACRSLYNLVDSDSGKVLAKNKALLSLKDYSLINRLEDIAEAGACSFKIEGRLKNISYVRNTVSAYSQALDKLVEKHPEKYRRASFGHISNGFRPDLVKTFNRGYTELFLDGHRGKWASMDAPKGMGEPVGITDSVRPVGKDEIEITIKPQKGNTIILANGDGFAFTSHNGDIVGFRGDVCSGNTIRSKRIQGLTPGIKLFRNISVAFEKSMINSPCKRQISSEMETVISGDGVSGYVISVSATTEDGRESCVSCNAGTDPARNAEMMKSMVSGQLCKSSGIYNFHGTKPLQIDTTDGNIPFVSSAFLNGIRRSLAENLDKQPVLSRPLLNLRSGHSSPTGSIQLPAHLNYKYNVANSLAREMYISRGKCNTVDDAYEISHIRGAELMRSKYCIRYELRLCPKMNKPGTPIPKHLHLENNGRKFALTFDCKNCEMVVSDDSGL